MLNRARAIENGAVVVAPCAVGEVPGGGAAYGHSLIVSPWGEVLGDGGSGVGYIVETVDIGSRRRGARARPEPRARPALPRPGGIRLQAARRRLTAAPVRATVPGRYLPPAGQAG